MNMMLPTPPAMPQALAEADMAQAVRARDAGADGQFFYAVLTTGVFCYPSCAARPARPENLRFFDTREAAGRAGYRPCKRCRPDLPPKQARERIAVQAACRAIEAGMFQPEEQAEKAGLSLSQFGRVFRRLAGVTLAAYRDNHRQASVRDSLTAGATVTDTIYRAGFGSSGRFYEAADGMLGMTPSAWRRGGAGETIAWACGETSLGLLLVAGTARGVCAILLGDTQAGLAADLADRFPRASLVPAGPDFAARLAEVVRLIERPGATHDLPLDIRGTAFQRKVWQALRAIPPGRTASYGEVAAAIGAPRGARAVAAACAANRLAVAVPCHRVVTGEGALSGYRWGVARKRALLERERS